MFDPYVLMSHLRQTFCARSVINQIQLMDDFPMKKMHLRVHLQREL